jgi:hypothetical protein
MAMFNPCPPQLTIDRFFEQGLEINKELKTRASPSPYEGHAEEFLEEQYRYLAISQKILLIHTQSCSVVIKRVAPAVVVLDVRLINTGQAIASVLPG